MWASAYAGGLGRPTSPSGSAATGDCRPAATMALHDMGLRPTNPHSDAVLLDLDLGEVLLDRQIGEFP